MGLVMSTIVKLRILLFAVALGATMPAGAVIAKSNYDGVWSVSIITESGTCDRGYRYRIRVVNGRIVYDDPEGPGVTVSGQVKPNGQVNVDVRRGDQRATGSGRLTGSSGSGRWSGRSANEQCSGRWEAERRAA
jgi:hypothetical protein